MNTNRCCCCCWWWWVVIFVRLYWELNQCVHGISISQRIHHFLKFFSFFCFSDLSCRSLWSREIIGSHLKMRQRADFPPVLSLSAEKTKSARQMILLGAEGRGRRGGGRKYVVSQLAGMMLTTMTLSCPLPLEKNKLYPIVYCLGPNHS